MWWEKVEKADNESGTNSGGEVPNSPEFEELSEDSRDPFGLSEE
jgi:hypothetical protein